MLHHSGAIRFTGFLGNVRILVIRNLCPEFSIGVWLVCPPMLDPSEIQSWTGSWGEIGERK